MKSQLPESSAPATPAVQPYKFDIRFAFLKGQNLRYCIGSLTLNSDSQVKAEDIARLVFALEFAFNNHCGETLRGGRLHINLAIDPVHKTT
jgi:hypothetical protein